jgi:hypothetical protein
VWLVYLGIFLGWAGSGWAREKPDAKNLCPGPARPDRRDEILCPGLAHGGYFLSGFQAVGPGLPKITYFSCPGPAQLGYRARFFSPSLARLYILAQWAGPFLGRVEPGRSGLASHAQAWWLATVDRNLNSITCLLFGDSDAPEQAAVSFLRKTWTLLIT